MTSSGKRGPWPQRPWTLAAPFHPGSAVAGAARPCWTPLAHAAGPFSQSARPVTFSPLLTRFAAVALSVDGFTIGLAWWSYQPSESS